MDFGKALKFSANEATVEDCYSYLDCDVVIIDRYVPSRLESDKACIAQDELPGGGYEPDMIRVGFQSKSFYFYHKNYRVSWIKE